MLICQCTREILTAARTYYVRTDGNDTNNGLANTAAGAFATIQKAVDVALNTLDFGGFSVTIKIGDGDYTAGASISGPQTGRGTLIIEGNTTTASSVHITVTNANAITLGKGASALVRAVKLSTTTGGVGLQVLNGSMCTIDNVVFGNAASYQLQVATGAYVTATGYSIVGSAANHLAISHGGTVYYTNITITLTGTPNFSGAFLLNEFCGTFRAEGITFAGTGATGLRYYMRTNAAVRVYGGGANYFPGNQAGQAFTGAEYDNA